MYYGQNNISKRKQRRRRQVLTWHGSLYNYTIQEKLNNQMTSPRGFGP